MTCRRAEVRRDAECQVAVVGGGIVGLAQALAAARRGLSVTVFERGDRATGASIRNFGMVWPIGLPAGPLRDAALLSRRIWLELAAAAGFWLRPCGSVHLAREPDEQAVLEEFVATDAARATGCELLTPAAVAARCPGARTDGLLCGLWSPTELAIDPRQAIAAVAEHLRSAYDVRLEFATAVAQVEPTRLRTTDGRQWRFDEAIVCGGADLRTLYPEVLARSGIRRCKLQMMRTVPQPAPWRLGTHVAGGATLRHYASFAACPSVGPMSRRISAQYPELDRYGIHVMAAQNELGEVTIGDSHQYGDAAAQPFDSTDIDDVILNHIRRLVDLADGRIAQRWHGVYARHPSLTQYVHAPQDGVTIVVNTNGLGMTMSFGLAEQARAAGDAATTADRPARAAAVDVAELAR